MPSTRLETRLGWIGDRHAEVIEAVHKAIVEGILIPQSDRHIRIMEYPHHAFAAAPHNGPNYTVVEITLFAGRSDDAKRRLYSAVAKSLEPFGVPAGDVTVILKEVPRENWGFAGVSALDFQLNFKIEV